MGKQYKLPTFFLKAHHYWMGEPLYIVNAANPAMRGERLYEKRGYTVVYKALSGQLYLNRYSVTSLYKATWLCEAYRARLCVWVRNTATVALSNYCLETYRACLT